MVPNSRCGATTSAGRRSAAELGAFLLVHRDRAEADASCDDEQPGVDIMAGEQVDHVFHVIALPPRNYRSRAARSRTNLGPNHRVHRAPVFLFSVLVSFLERADDPPPTNASPARLTLVIGADNATIQKTDSAFACGPVERR